MPAAEAPSLVTPSGRSGRCLEVEACEVLEIACEESGVLFERLVAFGVGDASRTVDGEAVGLSGHDRLRQGHHVVTGFIGLGIGS